MGRTGGTVGRAGVEVKRRVDSRRNAATVATLLAVEILLIAPSYGTNENGGVGRRHFELPR